MSGYVLTTSLDVPRLYPYRYFSAALPLPADPSQVLLVGINKNKRGSDKSTQFPNAQVTDGYDVLLFNDGVVTKKAGPYSTPHAAYQALETLAPYL